MSPEINQPSHLIGSSAARACEKQQKSFTVVTSFVVKERKSVGQGDYLVHSRVEHLSAIDPSQSSRSDAICVTRVYTASDAQTRSSDVARTGPTYDDGTMLVEGLSAEGARDLMAALKGVRVSGLFELGEVMVGLEIADRARYQQDSLRTRSFGHGAVTVRELYMRAELNQTDFFAGRTRAARVLVQRSDACYGHVVLDIELPGATASGEIPLDLEPYELRLEGRVNLAAAEQVWQAYVERGVDTAQKLLDSATALRSVGGARVRLYSLPVEVESEDSLTKSDNTEDKLWEGRAKLADASLHAWLSEKVRCILVEAEQQWTLIVDEDLRSHSSGAVLHILSPGTGIFGYLRRALIKRQIRVAMGEITARRPIPATLRKLLSRPDCRFFPRNCVDRSELVDDLLESIADKPSLTLADLSNLDRSQRSTMDDVFERRAQVVVVRKRQSLSRFSRLVFSFDWQGAGEVSFVTSIGGRVTLSLEALKEKSEYLRKSSHGRYRTINVMRGLLDVFDSQDEGALQDLIYDITTADGEQIAYWQDNLPADFLIRDSSVYSQVEYLVRLALSTGDAPNVRDRLYFSPDNLEFSLEIENRVKSATVPFTNRFGLGLKLKVTEQGVQQLSILGRRQTWDPIEDKGLKLVLSEFAQTRARWWRGIEGTELENLLDRYMI